MEREFIVCIHDACPQSSHLIIRIINNITPLVENIMTVAVIPQSYGIPWRCEDQDLICELRERTTEILLHGLTHRRVGNCSPFSFLIEKADELVGLSVSETETLLKKGQHIMKNMFGSPAKGFVPPGWQFGKVTKTVLGKHNIDFAISLHYIIDTSGHRIPLATWFSGYVGEIVGYTLCMRKDVVPCIVLHPKDVQRGFLPRGLRLIRSFIEQGYCPISFQDIYLRVNRQDYEKHHESNTKYTF